MLAQSLVEYGLLERLITAGQALLSTADEWLLAVSPTTWLLFGVAVLLVLRVWSRRR